MDKAPVRLRFKIGSTPEPPVEEEDKEANSDHDEQDQVNEDITDENSRDRHRKSKKKKKKKEKDRHRHKRDRSSNDQDSVDKKMRLEDDLDSKAALVDLLNYLCKQLEKKDTNMFFVEPVTDALAPGYSSIITQPMCISRIREKIHTSAYDNLQQFEDDVQLIGDNSSQYNGSDSVYTQAACKLLSFTQSFLNRDKLLALQQEVPTIALLRPAQVGFQLIAPEASLEAEQEDSALSADSSATDDETQETLGVVRQAQEAARAAALKRHAKGAPMGYLRTKADGTMGLNFLSGCEDASGTRAKPLTLGLAVGKLALGCATLNKIQDEKRWLAKPVKPLSYGPYASFCPTYDSTFANLSKEESDLVRGTYGNDTAVQYSESIMDFSSSCPMAMTLVDQLLDLLTANQHSPTMQQVKQGQLKRQEEEQLRAAQEEQKVAAPKPDFTSLRALQDLGIDTSFVDQFEQAETSSERLRTSGALIAQLQREQNERLSKSHQGTGQLLPSQPTQQEVATAGELTAELVAVARQLPPSALLPQPVSNS